MEKIRKNITAILITVTDNRKFWKTVKPFLSDKIVSTQKIILVESDKIISKDSDTAQILITFFSNIFSNLKIPKYVENNPISGNIKDPILKLSVKYRNHPSILAIREVCTGRNSNIQFSFSQIDKKKKFDNILSLNTSKATQDTDVPTGILKENADIFAEFLHHRFNLSVEYS